MTQDKIRPEKEIIERYCLICDTGGGGYYFCAFGIDYSDMSDLSDFSSLF